MGNWSIRTKLLSFGGILLLALFVVIAFSYFATSSTQERLDQAFHQNFAAATVIGNLNGNLNAVRAELVSLVASNEREAQLQHRRAIEQFTALIEADFELLRERLADDAQASQHLDGAYEAWAAFRDTRDEELIPAALEGDTERARGLALGVQLGRYETFREEIVALGEQQTSTFEEMLEASQREASAIDATMLGIVVTTMLVVAFSVYFVNRLIRPIGDLARDAGEIAKGDIDQEPTHRSGDELGVLAQSFRDLIAYVKAFAEATERLREGDLTARVTPRSDKDSLSRNFNQAVEALQAMAVRSSESVGSMTSSASVTMAGVSELTAAAQQQAAAVSQTTTTVEELRQSSDEVAERAQHVATIARESEEAAEQGESVIEETVEEMRRITEQIEQIAQSILSLSEQTQAAGKITSSVNDIAEQSKMLAFNASIEAAKAGEAGKGFAVVASEIRSLADQSKAATGQIAEILSDIRKAAQQSVMTIEQGSSNAQRGMELADVSGKNVHSIAESIRKTAQLATQIETATTQQAHGMDQIANAMSSVNEATSQALGSSKEMELAMKDLTTLADQLDSSVAVYRLS